MTLGEPPPKDGARGWACCFAYFVTIFLNFGNARLLGMFYVDWAKEFGVSSSLSSWMSATAFFMIGSGSLLASFLLGFFSPAVLVFGSGLLASTGFIGISLAQKFSLVVILNLIVFTGAGITTTCAYVCVSEWTDRFRPLAIGLGTLGSPLAAMVLPWVFEFLQQEFGWRWVFFNAGGLFLNHCVAALVLRRYPSCFQHQERSSSEKPPQQEQEHRALQEKGKTKSLGFDLGIFRSTLLRLLLFFSFCTLGASNGFVAYLPSVPDNLRLSVTEKSVVLISFGSTDLFSRLFSSSSSSFPFVRRRRLQLLCVNELVMMASSLWIAFARDFHALIGVSVVFGATYGVFYSVFVAVVPELCTRRHLPIVIGTCYLVGGISSLLVPPFAGFVADSVGEFVVVFLIFAALKFAAACCICGVALLRRRWPSEEAE